RPARSTVGGAVDAALVAGVDGGRAGAWIGRNLLNEAAVEAGVERLPGERQHREGAAGDAQRSERRLHGIAAAQLVEPRRLKGGDARLGDGSGRSQQVGVARVGADGELHRPREAVDEIAEGVERSATWLLPSRPVGGSGGAGEGRAGVTRSCAVAPRSGTPFASASWIVTVMASTPSAVALFLSTAIDEWLGSSTVPPSKVLRSAPPRSLPG